MAGAGRESLDQAQALVSAEVLADTQSRLHGRRNRADWLMITTGGLTAAGEALAVPKYVVLGGEGSHDYENYLGFGDALIPTLLTPAPGGLLASNNLYADVVGNDWLPEMAIGRLLVIDVAELAAVMNTMFRYFMIVAGSPMRL